MCLLVCICAYMRVCVRVCMRVYICVYEAATNKLLVGVRLNYNVHASSAAKEYHSVKKDGNEVEQEKEERTSVEKAMESWQDGLNLIRTLCKVG